MPKQPQDRVRGVLFDWSGTLLNNLKPSYKGWMACFALVGHPPITLRQFRDTYCLPWQSFYRRYGISAKLIQRYHTILQTIYWQPQQHSVPLSPGAKRLIKTLKRKGIAIGILSDDPRHEIVRQLRRHSLSRAFTFIGTSEQYRAKPSPASVRAFLRHAKLPASEVLFIGDLTDDIAAGRAAGVITVAYLNGWHTQAMLRKAMPDYAIHQLKEIYRFIKK